MEQGWSRQLAWNRYFRGMVLVQQGEVPAAEPFLIQSLNMAGSWGERKLIARNKQYLIAVYLHTGRRASALQTAREAYDLYERLGMHEDAKHIIASHGELFETAHFVDSG
jgi:Holliday junction resolvase-like predicted endonuclease